MKIDATNRSRRRLSGRRRIGRIGPSAYRFSVTLGISPFGPKFPAVCSSKFLIANPRLEFPLSHSKQRTGAKSNRERMAIPCFSFLAFSGFEPQAGSLHNPWPPCRGRLIVTPRLEFRATPTKQTSSLISNRYKMRFSRPSSIASMPPHLAATRLTRYNSGSHIEVNQL
jgi:hypothetical protein